MSKCYFTARAIEDLTFIWEYTVDEWSEFQAEKYYRIIMNGCREISVNPSLGKKYFEIHDGLYGEYVAKHTVFYKIISPNVIEVARILHASMDVKNKFSE